MPLASVLLGLATPIFSLSSLEPKSLRMVILTIILVQVLCCLYQSPKHYIKIWHERSFSLHVFLARTKGATPAPPQTLGYFFPPLLSPRDGGGHGDRGRACGAAAAASSPARALAGG